MDISKKRIVILYGGPSAEREVSLNTGQGVYNALKEAGWENIELMDAMSVNLARLANDRPDICFNAVHGKFGEDGGLQGYLEVLGIPYTGSGIEASALAFDKHLSKLVFEKEGLHVPETLSESSLRFPCVVKPARGGSSIGITVVKSEAGYAAARELAARYDNKVLTEAFISGLELTVSVLNGIVLPVIWIRPASGVYDYESKYTAGKTEYLFELGLEAEEIKCIEETALRAYKVLEAKGAARTDVLYDTRTKTPYVLELNTMPGMTATSLLPKAAGRAGISFAGLIRLMLEDAIKEDYV